ncbi:DUF1643 domain-containing protein [Bacillus sp. DJP31]|uniref:DUF1643 domain-containing protein n=1 Tax=Bacillus sp. DJP31 TaxID=3409789 RepID=UPI003BB517F2
MKVSNFLIDKGYGSLMIVNLFSYITTDPEGLSNNKDITRIETDIYIRKAIEDTDTIIMAWGSDKSKYVRRKKELLELLNTSTSTLMCFKDKENKMGRHPSRLGNDLELCGFLDVK